MLTVSPQHRVWLASPRFELMFGAPEVLVPAGHLLHADGIARAGRDPVQYVHFMCEQHELVLSDGVWTESFQPGDQSLAGLDAACRAELATVFPDLARDPQSAYPGCRKP